MIFVRKLQVGKVQSGSFGYLAPVSLAISTPPLVVLTDLGYYPPH